MTIVRKEFRKPYVLTKGGYPEMMRATWEKSVWNSFLETDARWAEFLFVRSEVPDATSQASARRLKYLKQSEFKKPYDISSADYPIMEYLWNGPIPGIDSSFTHNPFSFPDYPWVTPEGAGPDEPTTYNVCDADCEGECCYCEGQKKEITASATYPIIGAEPVFSEGETFSIISGIGTTQAVIEIDTPSGRIGQMVVEVFMILPNGNTCSSTFNIFPCDEELCCGDCDLEWDWGTSDETIAPPGSGTANILGGTPPFKWTITSEDGLWTLAAEKTDLRTNTVNAAAGACGSATINVTDGCDESCKTTGSMRNPGNGSWVFVSNNQCIIPGAQDGVVTDSGNYLRTLGKFQQRQTYGTCKGASTGGCNPAFKCGTVNCTAPPQGACTCNGSETECITLVCAAPKTSKVTGGQICCSADCAGPPPGASEFTCHCNISLSLYEWKC